MKKRWARAILYESLFFTIIISLFVIKITYSVVENDNVVEIDSKVLSDRNELSKYASSIAKQYLYKHNLTEYEQYSMDDRGLGMYYKPKTTEYPVISFAFKDTRISPEELRSKKYGNFDCSGFVQNVYYNAYGYSFLDMAKDLNYSYSIVINDEGKIVSRADNYNYANTYTGNAISTGFFMKMAKDSLVNGTVEKGKLYKASNDTQIARLYYARSYNNDYLETDDTKKKITDEVLKTLQNGDLLVIQWDKDGDGIADSGHVLFYTNDDIYYYKTCDSDGTNCKYAVQAKPLKSGFIHSSGADFNFDNKVTIPLAADYFAFDDTYSVAYLPFSSDDMASAIDYLFGKRNTGTLPCLFAILRPLNDVSKSTGYTNSLIYDNDNFKNKKKPYTRVNTVALSSMSDLKFMQNVAFNKEKFDTSDSTTVSKNWKTSGSVPKNTLSNYDSVNALDILEYNLTIENMENNSNTYNLVAKATIPDGTEFLRNGCYSSTGVTCTVNNNELVWSGINPKNGKITLAFKVKVLVPEDNQNATINFDGIRVTNGTNTLKMSNIITYVNPTYSYQEREKAISVINSSGMFDNKSTTLNIKGNNVVYNYSVYNGNETSVLSKITNIYNKIFNTNIGDISNYKNSIFVDLDSNNDLSITLTGENKIINKNANDNLTQMLVKGLWGGRRVRGNVTHDRTTTFNVSDLLIGDIILGTSNNSINQAIIYLGNSTTSGITSGVNSQMIYYDNQDGNVKFVSDYGTLTRAVIVDVLRSDTFVVLRPSQVIGREVVLKNGNEVIARKLVTKGSTFGKLPELSKTGYKFDGWYSGSVKVVENTTVSSQTSFITLSPKFVEESYKVTFDSDGGSTLDPIDVTYNKVYGNLPVPSKVGYTFKDWYFDEKLTKVVDSNTVVVTTCNHTLYAKWIPNVYQVSFNTNGGRPLGSIEVTYDKVYGTLPIAVKDGYNFLGWYLDKELTKSVDLNTVVSTASNHTLYARYSTNEYSLTIDLDGGIYDGNTSIILNPDNVYILNIPKKNGYTFVKWEVTGKNSAVSGNTFKMGTENATVKAIWEANTYLVTYSSDTELDKEEKSVVYGSKYGNLPVPEKYGYKFLGWYLDSSYKNMVDKDTIVTTSKNHVLYAKYEVNAYLLTIDSNGGIYSGILTSFVEVDENYILNTPTREGYTFVKWEVTGKNSAVSGNTFKMGTENATVKAIWEANTYTIAYFSDTDVDKESKTVIYDGVYGTLPIPSKTGYKFLGWYLDGSYNNKVDQDTIVKTSKSHVLYAKYEANRYKLTINVAGGIYDGKLELELGYNEKFNLMSPTRNGYLFVGWTINNDKTKIDNNILTMKDIDTTIIANWKKIEIEPYAITDISIDGVTIDKFNTNLLNYNISTDKEFVIIGVATNNVNAKVDYPKGNVELKYGVNIIKVTLTNVDNVTVVYTLNITRSDLRDNNNYLESIKLFGKNVDINKVESKYVIDFDNEVKQIKISDIKYSDKATINAIYNNKIIDLSSVDVVVLNEGLNYLVINVVAENEMAREYTFILNRKSFVVDNNIINADTSDKTVYVVVGIIVAIVFALGTVVCINKRKDKSTNYR